MGLTLTALRQTPVTEKAFAGTKEGKLIAAFDKELLGLLLNPDETFEVSSKRHLVIDLAVLKAIISEKLDKASDGKSKELRALLIGEANVEKARRFGHDVDNAKAAVKVLNDLKVPDFNALQKKGVLGIRLDIDENTTISEAAPVVPTFTSSTGLSFQLTFNTTLVAPSRTPKSFGSSLSRSVSTNLQLPRSDKDRIIREFGYDPALISAEYVNGKLVSGELEPGRIYNVILLNSEDSRDGGMTKGVRLERVEFYERENEALIFLGGRRVRLPVYLQERHYAFLGEPKTLPHAIFPRAEIRRDSYDDVWSAARTLERYGVRRFDDTPKWITSSARDIPQPVAHFMGRNTEIYPKLSRDKIYTLITDFGNVYSDRSGKTASGEVCNGELYEPSSSVYDFNGCIFDPGFPGKVFILEVSPLEDPLAVSKVGEPILLSNSKAGGNDFRTQNYVLEQVIQKLDSDKTYLFLQRDKKPQVGRPITYWTTMDRRNGRASVVILTKEGRAIQTHTGSVTLAIPLDINQGPVLDEAKLIDHIDTVRRINNFPMPNETDLKIALGLSKAPSVKASPDQGNFRSLDENRFERDRWTPDMRNSASDVRENSDVFSARGHSDDEIIEALYTRQTVSFINFDRFIGRDNDTISEGLLRMLNETFHEGQKILVNGEALTIGAFLEEGVVTNDGIRFYEDIERLKILGKADDLVARAPIATNGDFLAVDHSEDEITQALNSGIEVDFFGVDFTYDKLNDSFQGKSIKFNGEEGIISCIQPRGIDVRYSDRGFEYKSLAESPFKIQLLKSEPKAFVSEPKSIIVQPGDDPEGLSRNLEAGGTLGFPVDRDFNWRMIANVNVACNGKRVQVNDRILDENHLPFGGDNYFVYNESGNNYRVRDGYLTISIVQ